MFGAWRFVLALLVVSAHIGGVGGFAAGYAVFAFYMLSGYLISFIASQRYAGRLGAFCLNRGLRIYPMYWIGCAATLILILIFGPEVAAFHPNMVVPTTAAEILSNIFIVGLAVSPDARLVPPAWAVANELIIYAAIALVFARGKWTNVAWLAAGIAYHIIAYRSGWDRYYSLFAASLPFSVGACLFHFRASILHVLPAKNSLAFAAIGICISAMVIGASSDSSQGLVMYVNIVAAALLLHQLAGLRSIGKISGLDRFLGDLSYPVYLFHYHVGAVGFILGLPRSSVSLLAFTVPILLVVATFMAWLSNRTIERVRRRVAEPALAILVSQTLAGSANGKGL